MTLELIVMNLINHARARSGAGHGNYAHGVRYAIDQLLPDVDVSRQFPGVSITIGEALRELDERLQR